MVDAGNHDFVGGRISMPRFQDRLASIWSGLSLANGRAAYHGTAGNRATITRANFDAAMREIFGSYSVGNLSMFLYLKKRRKFPSIRIPSFRFWKALIGTVYLVQSRGEPRLFKVGLTARKTTERRSELNRLAGDDMRIVETVQLAL